MDDRPVYCYGVDGTFVPTRQCALAMSCRRWVDLQTLRRTDAEPLRAKGHLCQDQSYKHRVPV